ncbi:serine/threonine-protein kinase [Streptomyces macrosporus]|uniref:non-specific serine/threonine protein kinase n=1 Tax=Streptomyces macrosporus TaxID=44032 RepID=A0ABP5XGZ0_9ACTN
MNVTSLIAKRYRIKNLIGRGGMGVVWLAHDENLGRDVALKTMAVAPGITEEQRARDAERFRREAQAVARLDHPGLATVYDLGEENDTRFLVMQYVIGTTLADRIAEEGPLPIEETAAIGVQIASVLGSVHARNVVHRDLKGSNVVIRTDGVVKVLDFGVAAFLDPDITRLTTTGERPGSLECMAPEQTLGKPIDHRVDLYALGCLLYNMLTGDPVFAHDSELMLLRMIMEQPPVPPKSLRNDIPDELEELVLQLLAKNPDHRPDHAGEVWQRLAAWLPERGAPEAALTPWVEVDPLRPFTHPMAPEARPVREWAQRTTRRH